jgi:type I restriction enzyme, R subunit
VIDVLALAGEDRPNLSVLSDDFLDTLGQRVPQENLRKRLLEKLLADEIVIRERQNPMQAQLFGDKLQGVLAAYDRRQLTTAQVIERLIELAKELRDARTYAAGIQTRVVLIDGAELAELMIDQRRWSLCGPLLRTQAPG